jgi:REP element-mobilizing transposase RayT
LRIEIEDGIYHVTARGWERRVIVRDDRDREEWCTLLDRVVLRFGWRFFAWVLMDNHFHLFFQTPEANLSAGMHDFNSGYATWFNRRHRRVGSLFHASPLKEVVGKVLLGSAAWEEEMRKTLSATEADRNVAERRHLAWHPSPEQIELAVAEAFAVDVSQLFAKRIRNNEARAAAVYLNRMLTSVSATDLAERYGGVSQAAISKTVQRAEARRKENRRWNPTLARLEKSLRRAK